MLRWLVSARVVVAVGVREDSTVGAWPLIGLTRSPWAPTLPARDQGTFTMAYYDHRWHLFTNEERRRYGESKRRKAQQGMARQMAE
ncbi:hypothetical protein D3C81_2124100 [compost metagenome]